MIAVFARSNHPVGYGRPSKSPQEWGTAHGYVVLLVKCKNKKQVKEVADRLFSKPFHGLDRVDDRGYKTYATGWLGEWYGSGGLDSYRSGFDLLSVISGNEAYNAWITTSGVSEAPRYNSKGDNRFVGIYDAEDILSE